MDKLRDKYGGDSTDFTVSTVDGLHEALNKLENKGMGQPALIN